jgi:GNAT superfamily N-acetyltransferase
MLTVMPYDCRDIDRLARLLARYTERLPRAKVMSAEFYTYHPASAGGRNAVAVYDERGELAGFAPLFGAPVDAEAPPTLPHTIWSVMLVDPTQPDPAAVRDLLYAAMIDRSRELVASYPPRRARLAADYMGCQTDEIADLLDRGFTPFARILVMTRPLDGDLPPAHALPGVSFAVDRLATVAAQMRYLAAYNVCFPELPKTLDDLRFLLASPLWTQGFALTASTADELIGSVLVFGSEPSAAAQVDDVFVLPAWRGRRLATGILAAALRQARTAGWTAGWTSARLEVDAANLPAVALYRASGFAVADEEILLGLDLILPAESTSTNRKETEG